MLKFNFLESRKNLFIATISNHESFKIIAVITKDPVDDYFAWNVYIERNNCFMQNIACDGCIGYNEAVIACEHAFNDYIKFAEIAITACNIGNTDYANRYKNKT